MPRFAIDIRDPENPVRVKATKEFEGEDYEKGQLICPNPHCRRPMFIKGNDLAPSRIQKRKERGEEESPVHVRPHFSHYEAPEEALKYREEEVIAHELGCIGVEQFLGIPDIDIELWFEGSVPEETVSPDSIYRYDLQQYALEVQHSSMSVDEFERRQSAYPVHGLIPIWILHKKESEKLVSEDGEEIGRGNFGKIGAFYRHNQGYSQKATLYSKFERRLARRQGWMIYYEFVGKKIYSERPRIKLTAVKYEKMEKKKQSYYVTERYDITTVEEFQYIISQIKTRRIKYEDLRRSANFNADDHYAYNELKEEWYVHTVMHRCAETGKEVFFPAGMNVPSTYIIPSARDEVWSRTHPSRSDRSLWFEVEDQRWND